MSYPPAQTNQIQQALDRRDTMMTVPLQSPESSSQLHQHSQQPSREDQVPEEEKEAMRLKGGCIDLSPCG
jgi:hypothetical protein